MKKPSNIFLGFFLISVLLLSLTLVSSANTATLANPAANARVNTTTYILNATLDTNTVNLTSATFFYNTGGANTTIGVANNVTAVLFNFSWDTTAIDDINGLTVWVNVTNETNMSDSATLDSSLGVDVDNGLPTATIGSSAFTNNTAQILNTTFTFVIDADNSIGISSCQLYTTSYGTGTVTKTAVSAGANACTTSTSPETLSLSAQDQYDILLEATDGNGNQTNSSARQLVVTAFSGGGGGGGNGDTTTDDGAIADVGNAISSFFTGVGDFFTSVIDWFKNLFS